MTSKLSARDDLQQYTQGVAEAKNFVLSKFGPMTKRVGTKFVSEIGHVGEETALIPFVFSVDKSILLEVTSEKIRFYTFDGENFGQSRVYKLVTDDTNAEYSELYLTDGTIKEWVSISDKTKATRVYSDRQCTEQVGYVRNELQTLGQEIKRRFLYPGYAWCDVYNRILYINNTKNASSETFPLNFKAIPLSIDVSDMIYDKIHKRIILLENKSGNVYYLSLSDLDAGNTIFTKKTPATNKEINRIKCVVANTSGSTSHYSLLLATTTDGFVLLSKDGGETWKSFDLSSEIFNEIQYIIVGTTEDSTSPWVSLIDTYANQMTILTLTHYYNKGTLSFDSQYFFNENPNNYQIVRIVEDGLNIGNCTIFIPDKQKAVTFKATYNVPNPTSRFESTESIHIDYSNITLSEALNISGIGTNDTYLYTLYNKETANNDLYYRNNCIDNIHNWVNNSDEFTVGSSRNILYSDDGFFIDVPTLSYDQNASPKKIQVPNTLLICKSTADPTTEDKAIFTSQYKMSKDLLFYEYTFDTPLAAGDIKDISYAQSLDVLYLAFPDGKTPPKELRRKSDTNWEFVDFVTEDGPYGEINYDTSKIMTLSKHTASEGVTVTCTADVFAKTDVGRHIRLNIATYNKNSLAYEDHWTWGIITAYTDSKHVTATMKVDNSKVLDNGTAISASTKTWEWRLGAWNKETGYPTKVTIHEQRLAWSGITDRPWVWLSNAFAYRFYAPSEYDGTITDSNAINHDLSTDKISKVQWLKSVKNLIIGTEFEELRMLSSGPSLAPSDVAVIREASYGSYNAEPVITEDVIIFIQRLQRSLRALSYDYYRDAFLGPNLALLAEDLTLGGIKKIVYQKEPYSVLWVLKENGKLLTCTYDKEQEVVGWTECELAGDASVVDMMVFPSSNIKQDSVAFIVDRKIKGETKRYMELLTREYLSDVDIKDVTFMDSSIRYQGEPTTTIAGLNHLEGEQVLVVENGAPVGNYTVQRDAQGECYIEMEQEVSDAWIGLPYKAYFKTLERDFGDRQLSTHNAKIRIFKLYLTLIKTLGLTVQQLNDGEECNLIVFDPGADVGTAPEPVTGREELNIQSTWTNDIMRYSIKVNSIEGLPCTVAGITTGIEINAL